MTEQAVEQDWQPSADDWDWYLEVIYVDPMERDVS